MMIHPRTILWPTDFSPLSMRGLQYAQTFRRAFAAQLHVMHVCPPLVWGDSSVPLMSGGDVLGSQIDLLTPAKEQLSRLLRDLIPEAEGVRSHVVIGTPWYEICRHAEDVPIDLIVIATHGLTGLQHLLMGSTAERVVQHARCPVLVVKSVERELVEPATPTGAATRGGRVSSTRMDV